MRVLLTTDTIGGVWTFTKDLVSELLRQGHDTALLSFGRLPSPSQQDWCSRKQIEFGSRFEYVSSDVPLEWMETNTDSYSRGLPTILEVAARFRPHIVHSNQFCYGRLPLMMPVIITAHSDVVSWGAACRPDGLDNSPWLQRYRSLVQQGLDDASFVVAPTRWMLTALRKGFHLAAPTQTILNGRTLEFSGKADARSLQAVSAGRLWDQGKNLSLLTTIKSPMPILIAGEQQHGNATSTHTGTLTILGCLDEVALLSLFASSSVYLVASIYEPFGLAPLEAALCGCAIVANDIPSLREVWGEAALYFTDVTTLEQILIEFYNSDQHLAVAQRRSFKRAHQLTSKRMAEQYVALYRSLLHSEQPCVMQETATHVC